MKFDPNALSISMFEEALTNARAATSIEASFTIEKIQILYSKYLAANTLRPGPELQALVKAHS